MGPSATVQWEKRSKFPAHQAAVTPLYISANNMLHHNHPIKLMPHFTAHADAGDKSNEHVTAHYLAIYPVSKYRLAMKSLFNI